jgi:hypothetical protein
VLASPAPPSARHSLADESPFWGGGNRGTFAAMALGELEKLREATLRHLALPVEYVGKGTLETFEVVATVLGPRDEEELGEEPMRESLANHLAHRARIDIDAKAAGRNVVGIADSECDYSDEADCEGDQGHHVNAFVSGQRCYRIVLQIART